MHVKLYEDIARHGRDRHRLCLSGEGRGALRHGPLADPEIRQSEAVDSPAIQLFGAGREQRIYALPPYTRVVSLDFEDHPFEAVAGRSRLRAVRRGGQLSRRGHHGRCGRADVRLLGHRLLRRGDGREDAGHLPAGVTSAGGASRGYPRRARRGVTGPARCSRVAADADDQTFVRRPAHEAYRLRRCRRSTSGPAR